MTIRGAMTYNRYRVRRNTTEPGFSFEARNDQVSQTLLIPGLDRLNPNKLFAQGQPGGWADPYDLTRMWVDDAGTTPATIASLGTGIGRVVTKGGPAITLVQANAADRPVWGRHPVIGIRNLLTNSGFDGAVSGSPGTAPTNWTAFNLGGQLTITATGTLGGNAVQFAVTANRYQFSQTLNVAANTTYTWSSIVNVTSAVSGVNVNNLFGFNSPPAGAVVTYRINGVSVLGTDVIATGNNQLIECFLAVGATAGTVAARLGVGLLANGTATLSFRDPQFEVGTIRTTYQRVTNRFDITEVGSPSLYYFSFNGVNQSWSSNATVDFSTTDKVTIWAGLRKLSDVARGMVVELDNNNLNAFHLNAPFDANPNLRFTNNGSLAGGTTIIGFASPITLAVAAEGQISTDFTRFTVNGTSQTSGTDLGSGNYRNSTLHIGRRAGTTLPYNGLIYNLIVAGDNYDTRTVQRFSDWLLKPRRLITA